MAITLYDDLNAVVGTYATIQDAVDASSNGYTIIVGDGTYNENVLIDKSITLQSENGRDTTIIDGQDTGALGTIVIAGGTNGVTVEGFTILGLNGNGSVEKAAVYIDNANDDLQFLDNEIVARGDAGLMSEYNQPVTNVLIDGNIFSGQTFLGANPEGEGFSTQFTAGNNVPRQLVVMGSGNGTTTTNHITFTNNTVSGTAGGLNIDGFEQGNTLVTIDAADSTISDNLFTGETARYATAIRARGANTDIENNQFDNGSSGDTRGVYIVDQGAPGNYSGNVFTGNHNDDLFAGTPGDDTAVLNDGDDTFIGNGGNDTVDGLNGNDVFVVGAARGDATIVKNADGSYSVTDTVSGDTNLLYTVEGVVFSDGITYELDVNSPDYSGGLTRFDSTGEAGLAGLVEYGSTVTEIAGPLTPPSGGTYIHISASDNTLGEYGAYTRFDGYRSGESEGLTTTVKVYLDTSMAAGEGFDYSVGATKPDGAHLRDFVFHVTMDTSTGELQVGASNNTNFNPREDLETGNHAVIDTSGWYKFEHKFYENAEGNLEVAMNVYDAAGNWVFTEVRSNAGDDFDTMFGGNRYGWFTNVDVAGGIDIDDVTLATLNTDPVQVKEGNTIIATYATIEDAKDALENGDITATSAFIETTGADDGFFYVVDGMSIQAAVDAASDGDTIEVDAGTYTEQVVVDGMSDLSIIGVGSGDVTVAAPADVTNEGTTASGRAINSVITVLNSENIVIEGVTVDGMGVANTIDGTDARYFGVAYRNSSGGLEEVDITGVRDPYPGGVTAGGEPVVSGNQRGVGVLVDNDSLMDFFMHGGTISDFQKNGTSFNYANLDMSGVTVIGGGAQTINAQNGVQALNSSGTITGITIDGIGYAGAGNWGAVAMLIYSANGLSITDNTITLPNDDDPTATAYGIYIASLAGAPNTDLTVTGNDISHSDYALLLFGESDAGSLVIEDNSATAVDAGGLGAYIAPDSDGDFIIEGTEADDYFAGTAGNETYTGLGGDDYFVGGEGDDSLDGGDDTDTAAYDEVFADVTIGVTTDGNGFVTGFTSVTDNDTTDGDEGTDALTSIEVVELGDVTLDATQPVQLFDAANNLVGTFDTIQGAIDAASTDYTVRIGAGTYEENLSVNVEGLTLQGGPGVIVDGTASFTTSAGWNGTDPLNEHFEANNPASYSGGIGLALDADGVTISGLEFQGFRTAIQLGDTDGSTITGNTFTNNVTGIRKGTAQEVTNSEISGNSFMQGIYGINTYAASNGDGSFSFMTIDNNTFEALSEKGMYFEQLSDSTLTGNDFNDVGNYGRLSAAFGGTNGEFGQAIDINLKYGTYQNVTFIDTTIYNSGKSEGDGSPGLFGGAIGVKTRDDGGTYGANPASFTGQIVFQGGAIDDTTTGVRVGEPGKDNLGPNVLLDGMTIDKASVTDVENATDPDNGGTVTANLSTFQQTFDASTSQADVDVNGTAVAEDISTGEGDDVINGAGGDDTIDGGDGYDTAQFNAAFGAAAIDIAAGTVTTGTDGTDSFTNIEKLSFLDQDVLVVGNGGYATIQEAIDDALPGGTIYVAAGTYVENLVIGKELTIIAADGAVLTPASGNGITLTGDLGGGNVTIDNLDIIDGGTANEGVRVDGQANVGTLTLLNLSIEGFDRYGVRSSDGGLASPATLAALVMTGVDMDSNGTGGANGASHIKLFGYDGDVTLTDVTISGEDTGTATAARPDNAIEITGKINTNGNANPAPANPPSAGNIVFTNLEISGSYHKNPVALFHFADILGVDIQSLDLSGAESSWGPLFNIDGVLSSVIDASGFNITFPAAVANAIYAELQGEKADQGVVVDNVITGTAAADSMHGKSGNDTLNGEDGDDMLFGGNKPGGEFDDGEGDDVLNGGTGNDSAYGGLGDDIISGGSGDDSLEGDLGSDEIYGGEGNDSLYGGGASDILDGGSGDDSILAGGGRDTIIFSAGNDYVNGQAGQDELVLLGVASDYNIQILGIDHYLITRIADGAVTEAESIENLSFAPAAALDAVDDAFTVDAGDVRNLDVLANDTGVGTVIAASVIAPGQGSASPAGDGLSVNFDLTTAYKSLDVNQTATVDIIYLLSDGGSASDIATVTVTINGVADDIGAVTDADAGTPDQVLENEAIGTSVGITALAIDPDQGSTVTYSLLDDANGAFTIDPLTGEVTTAVVLDREGPDGPTRTIVVQAESSDGTTSTETFTIDVLDASDTGISTVSDVDGANNEVDENAANGTSVGVTALATDPDVADTVSYALLDDAGGAFEINATTGEVTVLDGNLIDRESDASLDVLVEATSTDGSTSTETFTIAINDVDEFDATTPVDTSGPAGGSVTENAANGTAVGILVSSTDDDATNNGITYSLVDDDGGRFVIGPVTGEVLVAGNIDREDGPTRSITVRATSEDGSFADQTFTIDVADVNEFAVSTPVDNDGAVNEVSATPTAGDATGVTAYAFDGDATNNTVTYSLLVGDDDFDIDFNTGVVTVDAGFNVAGPVTRTITVQALSSDGSTSTANFNISVGAAYNIIDGTPGKDDLFGTAGQDVINGYGEDDDLFGFSGDDFLNGGAGKDLLDGGEGADEMAGGLDNDDYYVDNVGDVVIENVGEGTRDTIFSSIDIAALAANVEYLELVEGSAATEGYGNELDNKMTGNSANNLLVGLGGRDKLYGNDGDDTLIGGDEVDILNGDAGNDRLIGNGGRNVLTGGDDADQFVFANMPVNNKTYDRIKDFDASEFDTLVLNGNVFTSLGATVDAGELVLGSAALDANDFLIYDAATNKLYYDADGNGSGAQQQIALLDGVGTLSVTDFSIEFL